MDENLLDRELNRAEKHRKLEIIRERKKVGNRTRQHAKKEHNEPFRVEILQVKIKKRVEILQVSYMNLIIISSISCQRRKNKKKQTVSLFLKKTAYRLGGGQRGKAKLAARSIRQTPRLPSVCRPACPVAGGQTRGVVVVVGDKISTKQVAGTVRTYFGEKEGCTFASIHLVLRIANASCMPPRPVRAQTVAHMHLRAPQIIIVLVFVCLFCCDASIYLGVKC